MKVWKILKIAALVGFISTGLYAQSNTVNGNLEILNSNGGWSWFQSERVIVHNGRIILTSVANDIGAQGGSRGRNIEVTTYNISADQATISILERYPASNDDDDHNVAGLLVRPDNRYLAVYARHNKDNIMSWTISSQANNSTSWGSIQTIDVGASNTYSNLFRLSDEGRVYNFHRGIGWNPNFMVSTNNGNTWSYGGRLLTGSGRPYVRYASNNRDVIHFINTEQHPRDYDNSIYHGYIRGGNIYNSQGNVIDNDLFNGTGASPTAPTRVYQGSGARVAWTSDIHLDENDNPFIAFSVQVNGNMNDLRYHYARWDGNSWTQYEIAYAGTALYSSERDYTGNIALDPNNPRVVYISADANPVTGSALISNGDNNRHYELFKGVTLDSGANWTWSPITENSTMDNIRPIVPIWNDTNTALVWMRGTYNSYTEYNTQVAAVIYDEPLLSVTSPNGGEVLQAGLQHEITWASLGPVSQVMIEFFNGNSWSTVVASTDNDSSYQWTVPNNIGSNARIRITQVSGYAEDQSDAVFEIAPPTSVEGRPQWNLIPWTLANATNVNFMRRHSIDKIMIRDVRGSVLYERDLRLSSGLSASTSEKAFSTGVYFISAESRGSHYRTRARLDPIGY